MIYYDPNEAQYQDVSAYTPCADLEAQTGADYLVTPSRMPIRTAESLQTHIRKFNAVLVQVKRGLDFYSSIGTRINTALGRMADTGARKAQCVLVTTGYHLPDAEGVSVLGHLRYSQSNEPYLHIQRQSGTRILYESVLSELHRWSMRGGVYVPLPSTPALPHFLDVLESWLKDLERRPTKEVYPDVPRWFDESDDPLQPITLINDGRAVLASMRVGIGPKLASLCIETWGDAATALMWLSNPALYERAPEMYPSGIGKGKVNEVYKKLGRALQVDPEILQSIGETSNGD